MNKITVVLLNWRRTENIIRLVESLSKQTERPVIYMWDNSPIVEFEKGPALIVPQYTREQVDWYVKSSENKQCMPRWWMAQQAKTPYVMSFDDDLMPSDNQLLSDLVQELDKEPGQFRIIGAFGKVLVPSLTYEHCPTAAAGEECDIVLGRVMAMRTRSIAKVLDYNFINNYDCGTVDDIVVSGMFRQVGSKHLCSKVFENRLTELPDQYALCKEPGHFERREAARRQFWY